MATAKTTTLAFRVERALYDALRVAPLREHGSIIAHMGEVMIRKPHSRSTQKRAMSKTLEDAGNTNHPFVGAHRCAKHGLELAR